MSDAGAGLSIYSGLKSGTPVGYASAGVNAAKLYSNLSGTNVPYVGPLGSALGIYSGIKQGGAVGYTQAALSAASLASAAGVGAGTALGASLAAAGPLALAMAPVLYGASKPAVQLGAKYWNNLTSGVKSGDAGATFELLQMAQTGDNVPQARQLASQLGLDWQNFLPKNMPSYASGTYGAGGHSSGGQRIGHA